jgi:hypothetical protein
MDERTRTERISDDGTHLIIVERWLDRQVSPPRWRSKNWRRKLPKTAKADSLYAEQKAREDELDRFAELAGRLRATITGLGEIVAEVLELDDLAVTKQALVGVANAYVALGEVVLEKSSAQMASAARLLHDLETR